MTTPNEITYFNVTGHYYDVEAPITSGTTNAPQVLVVSAFIKFIPRLPPGTALYVPNLDTGNGGFNTTIALAPITGRIYNGELQTIDRGNATDVLLVANTAILGLTELIYDVEFSSVQYAGDNHVINNFAFTAPTTNTTIDLSDPTLTRLQYAPLTK